MKEEQRRVWGTCEVGLCWGWEGSRGTVRAGDPEAGAPRGCRGVAV